MKKGAKILAMLIVALVMVSTATGDIIFVDADAIGANDGSSWADAYNDLQDALAVAQSGDEVRVSEGVYTPMGPLLPMLPGQADNPDPPDGAIDWSTYTALSWTSGAGATSHDVYFGTASPGTFQGNQTNTVFYVGTLDSNTTYYWRIDGVNWWDTTVGVVWSFTTGEAPPPPLPPTPPPWPPQPWPSPPLQANWNNSQVTEASLADREATFQLINGVPIKGGYAGFGESDPNVRDIQEYETVLSGDLNGDDVYVNNPADLLDGPYRAENSYNIVTGSGTDETAIMDGFTITGGNASSSNHNCGGGMFNGEGSPTVLNCTFRENAAKIHGGGIYNVQDSSTLNNCIFSGNFAGYDGGGIFTFSSIKVTDCTFTGNSASQGGGIYIPAIGNRDPKLTNCIFSSNSAEYGGAIFCQAPSYPMGISGPIPENSPMLNNCTISGNSANEGGGIYNNGAIAMLTNCTFSSNSADSGGGIYNDWGWPTVTNCTFSSNSADYGSGIYNYSGRSTLANCILWDGGNEIWNKYGSTFITYSDVQSGWSGEGNIDTDPLFVNPAAGNYHLSPDSPCIDVGDPNFVPVPGEMDVDGEPRVMGGRVDMGIDEFTSTLTPILRIWPTDLKFNLYADIHDSNSQILTICNTGSGTMDWRITENCPWLEVYSKHGTSIGEVNEVKVTVDITRLQPGAYNYEFRVTADGAVNSPWMVPVSLFVYESGKLHIPSEYTTIQEAIDSAFDGAIIIVAIGTYSGNGNRDIDYRGKAITVRSVDPNDPNTVAATIIDSNGTEEEPHRGFYFHSGEDANSVLSGLTIRNGYVRYDGGGIYCKGSSPTITNCTFRDNIAQYYYGYYAPPSLPPPPPQNTREMVRDDKGIHIMCPPPLPGWRGKGGGISCADSNAILINCKFTGNSAHEYGGGMYNYRSSPTLFNCTFSGNSSDSGGGMESHQLSSPTLTNCTFTANSAVFGGGGMRNSSSSPALTDCIFIDNSAGWSGGMGNYYSSPTLNNCTFSGNSANSDGGGMNNGNHCSPTLTTCTFSGNSAVNGGGMFNDSSSPTLTNCIFSENSADAGGGIRNLDSNPALTNCAFTGNSADSGGGGMYNDLSSSPTLTNCTFRGNLAKYGGGMYNWSKSRPALINCIFINNSVEKTGGGICNSGFSNPKLTNCTFIINSAHIGGGMFIECFSGSTVINCTFTKNYSDLRGGGIYSGLTCPPGSSISFPVITNCILYGNTPDEIYVDELTQVVWTPVVTFSDVQGGWPGEGNIDADPLFVKPGYWDVNGVWIEGDYHLLVDSPCIDSGDPNYTVEPNETDLDGKPRVISGRIDMGAYEYNPPIPAEARIVPRTINLASQGKWIIVLLWLPEDYNVADIDPNSLLLEYEIGPEQLWVNEEKQVVLARFSRKEVQAILIAGEVELTITGQLADGTVFEATDAVTVIDRGGGKSDK